MADPDSSSEMPDVGKCAAAIFALVAHRLSMFYEHGYWMTQAQAATLCSEWLLRSKLNLSLKARKCLADLSDQVAAQIRDSLSREAGLFTTHELMESLDERYISEVSPAIMDECVRVFREALQSGDFPAFPG
jgi:hypothetical protein